MGVKRWRSIFSGGSLLSALCPPCGCEALALQILRGIPVERLLSICECEGLALQILRGILVESLWPTLWVWSAGALDPEGDPRSVPSAPPVGVKRWRTRSSEGSSWSASASPCGCGALELQMLRGTLVERFGATVGQCHGGGLLAERPWPWKPKAPEHPSAPQLKGATPSLEEKNFENKKKN